MTSEKQHKPKTLEQARNTRVFCGEHGELALYDIDNSSESITCGNPIDVAEHR